MRVLPAFIVVSTIFFLGVVLWKSYHAVSSSSVSSSSIFDQIGYDDHCASLVPEEKLRDTESTIYPFPNNQKGYFLGGNEFHTNSSNYSYSSSRGELYLRTDYVYHTSYYDVHKVVADLILETQETPVPMLGPADFKLEGFWSLSTGKLCMVGYAPKKAKGYAVLKLSGVKNSCNITSLITGTLERSRTLSSPFQPVPLLMFPMKKCEAAKVLQAAASGLPAEIDNPKELSFSLPHNNPFWSICDYYVNWFQLESGTSCKSPNGCNPFAASLGYQPQKMLLSIIQCSEDTRSARFLVQFFNSSYVGNDHPFNTSSSLVAHGTWDPKKRQMFAVACRMFASASCTFDNRVDDCSMRLSLRLPATWSVGNANAFVGYLWSNKKKKESGYFDQIKFRSSETSASEIQGLKYNYTLVERATGTCQKKNSQANVGKQYPEGKEYAMRFRTSIKNIKGNGRLFGYFTPVFVDDQPWHRNSMGEESSQVEAKFPHHPVKISYDLMFDPYDEPSRSGTIPLRISAKGTYNPGTGLLCMIGCRFPEVWTSATDAMDCEILIVVQFPPIYSNEDIEGRIESLRGKSDHLHFEAVSFSAVPSYIDRIFTWRMAFENLSYSLVGIFVAYQINYMKKQQSVFRLISLVMLVVLTLGQMIPLLLSFEAFFSSRGDNGGIYSGGLGGWPEIYITMVVFMVQVRLLQLVLSARMADGNQTALWIAEKKTLCICLPLYIAGGLIAFLVNHHSIWNDSKSYIGLIMDGFLLPQVLFNIFQSSSEHPLSRIFYLGITFVRLVPHAYGSLYANPGADYFSKAWDAIILVFGLLFAALIFLHQRFGGRCILPHRFKQAIKYKKLPVETSRAQL